MGRVDDKIKEVEEYLDELELIIPEDLDEYLDNLEKRLACERVFEKIIEAVNNLAILFLKQERFELPTEDIRAFEIIADKNIISSTLALDLKQAKGMRNFLAHQYDKIDDEKVFDALRNKISNDINEFIEGIKRS